MGQGTGAPLLTQWFGSREIALGAVTLLATGSARRNLVLVGMAVDAADAGTAYAAVEAEVLDRKLGMTLVGVAGGAVLSGLLGLRGRTKKAKKVKASPAADPRPMPPGDVADRRGPLLWSPCAGSWAHERSAASAAPAGTTAPRAAPPPAQPTAHRRWASSRWASSRWAVRLRHPAFRVPASSSTGSSRASSTGWGSASIYGILSAILSGIFLSGFNNSVGELFVFYIFLSLVTTAISLGYYGFMESSNGATFGKQLMKLKVVGPDGASNPTMKQAIRRNIFLAFGLAGIVPVVGQLLGGAGLARRGDHDRGHHQQRHRPQAGLARQVRRRHPGDQDRLTPTAWQGLVVSAAGTPPGRPVRPR